MEGRNLWADLGPTQTSALAYWIGYSSPGNRSQMTPESFLEFEANGLVLLQIWLLRSFLGNVFGQKGRSKMIL